MFRFLKIALPATAIVLALLATSGCSNIEPWVKPYERDKLADPVMSLSRHGKASSYMHHVYQSRESSRGSEGGSGGGCGCN
ncbi:DUF4266 domain-containing protein [Marinobacter confluentis]|uniref:DUF4266 domain-containing protein n=1 Tax=Marinobacter confluentis TaxID=1697557 RepID=A0A4Z1BN28_9GAMM|nr:DUF4266 domain-containing protein [Marinobacter confluentis]TGN41387.1 DUF4266 domain-containing protein [Marinobacter confluentis]